MLFIDRDELLYCPGSNNNINNTPKQNMKSKSILALQREYQHNYIKEMSQNGINSKFKF